MPENNESKTSSTAIPSFPAWLRELCYFGGIIVTLSFFLFNIKASGQSTSDKVDRLSEDVRAFSQRLSSIETRLPNEEAEGLKLQAMQKEITTNHEWVKFELAKLDKWKENTTNALIKKGIVE